MGRMALSEEAILRYSRHILLKEVGGRGQERLLGARVRLLGDGPGLAAATLYLVAAGIGTIALADPGLVSDADLGQWLYGPEDRGLPRAAVLAREGVARNPAVTVLVDSQATEAVATLDVTGKSASQALQAAADLVIREILKLR